MAAFRHFPAIVGAALLVALVLLASGPSAKAAAPTPACAFPVLYVAAHQDDTLLFQSPSLLQDIRSGRCVRTVFVTAGDAGRAEAYWGAREEGAQAAYAQMAGVDDEWTFSQLAPNGHPIRMATLEDAPKVSIVYMRLPDGAISGKGNERYGFQSLTKLWKSGNDGTGSSDDGSLAAVDGSTTYGYEDLIETLAALIRSFEPRLIAVQNYTEPMIGDDHPDHVAGAYFARAADRLYERPHRLVGYKDYGIGSLPQNVFGELLGAKSFAFYTYGLHDSDACVDEPGCAGTPYAQWLGREYTVGAETIGLVADAGYAQVGLPGETVGLDGSRSSSDGGAPLSFEWSQIGGPRVALAGAETATPSVTTPRHPTLLTFSLVVSDGERVSDPDFVRVRVPTSDPHPVAVADGPASVNSGATVTLDGSASWDPDSLPLEYAWLQTAGPEVELSSASSQAPSFIAPSAGGSLSFVLIVSNGSVASAPAPVTVEVVGAADPDPGADPPVPGRSRPSDVPVAEPGPAAPPGSLAVRLARGRVWLPVDGFSRRVIGVSAPVGSAIACRGSLPAGARCRVNSRGQVVVEGSRIVERRGTYRLTVQVWANAGTYRLPLAVRFGQRGRWPEPPPIRSQSP